MLQLETIQVNIQISKVSNEEPIIKGEQLL